MLIRGMVIYSHASKTGQILVNVNIHDNQREIGYNANQRELSIPTFPECIPLHFSCFEECSSKNKINLIAVISASFQPVW